MLRRPPVETYHLEPGDTLGIYIEGILGSEESMPPVNIPDSPDPTPSIGYPFPIRKDGTIALQGCPARQYIVWISCVAPW